MSNCNAGFLVRALGLGLRSMFANPPVAETVLYVWILLSLVGLLELSDKPRRRPAFGRGAVSD